MFAKLRDILKKLAPDLSGKVGVRLSAEGGAKMKRIICALMSLLLLFGLVTVNFSYAESEIEEHLKTLEIGSPFNYRNLTIVPVYAKSINDKTDYVSLDEAVNKGYITISELDGGRVPQVRLKNNSGHYILLVAGEILTGCRQDRLVGRDALIGPKSKDIILPVYCSEHGRWTSKGTSFDVESSQAEPLLRGKIYARESQSAIWEGIAGYSQKLSVRSESGALQDVYRDKDVKEKIQTYVEKLEDFPRLEEDAVGVVVGLGDKIIGVDIFASPGIFVSLWPKLLKSYAALAIAEESLRGTLTQKQAKDMLNEVYRAEFSRQQGLDLGEDLQAGTRGMVCSALTYHSSVVHLGVFPTDTEFSRGSQDSRIPLIE